MTRIIFTVDGADIQALVAADALLNDSGLAPLLQAAGTQVISSTEVGDAFTGSTELVGVHISIKVAAAQSALDSITRANKRAGFQIKRLEDLASTIRAGLTQHSKPVDTSDDVEWVATFDGASRGNPGPAAVGATLTRDGNRIDSTHKTIGTTTNNVAEYRALEAALELASENSVSSLTLRGDSQLIIKQVTGEWNANEKLGQLRDTIHDQLSAFTNVEFEHVSRNDNRAADSLANRALDACEP
ncbi:ribonuclease HI family protein [Haloarcula sp. H-GB5]|jgi:ribonuclease HI